MDCQTLQARFDEYLDRELPAEEAAILEAHVHRCAACADELDRFRLLADQLHQSDQLANAKAPPRLWVAIEQQLRTDEVRRDRGRLVRILRRPLALAACFAALIGGVAVVGFILSGGAETAHASAIDYRLLLDGVNTDVDGAIQRFLEYYDAQPIPAENAKAAAPELSFAIPQQLPGGYGIEKVFRLRFGDSPGIAAVYRRNEEPLAVLFHPPVRQEEVGSHRQLPCIIGGRHGHQVEVGRWRLVHFTDATTCHCVLSTLDPGSELSAVFAAVAPNFTSAQDGHGHQP